MNKNKTIELEKVIELTRKPGHLARMKDELFVYGDKQVVHKGEIVTKDRFYELVDLIPEGLGNRIQLKGKKIEFPLTIELEKVIEILEFSYIWTHKDIMLFGGKQIVHNGAVISKAEFKARLLQEK